MWSKRLKPIDKKYSHFTSVVSKSSGGMANSVDTEQVV